MLRALAERNRIHRLGSLPPLDRLQDVRWTDRVAPAGTAQSRRPSVVCDAAVAARIAAVRGKCNFDVEQENPLRT